MCCLSNAKLAHMPSQHQTNIEAADFVFFLLFLKSKVHVYVE